MSHQPTPNDIITQVCISYGISHVEMLHKSRKRDYVEPRQVAMYLMRTLLPALSFSDVARILRKDHTTVMHSVQLIKNQMEVNPQVSKKVTLIKNYIFAQTNNTTELVFVGREVEEYKAVYDVYVSKGKDAWLEGLQGLQLALALTQQLVDELHRIGYKIQKV